MGNHWIHDGCVIFQCLSEFYPRYLIGYIRTASIEVCYSKLMNLSFTKLEDFW